jgi:hypothetical protein
LAIHCISIIGGKITLITVGQTGIGSMAVFTTIQPHFGESNMGDTAIVIPGQYRGKQRHLIFSLSHVQPSSPLTVH